MIGDPDRKVADLYDMIHPNASDTVTVRTVFVIGPDKKVKVTLTYPQSAGRNFDEILRLVDSLQLSAELLGVDAGQLEGRRGRHHHAVGHRRGGQGEVPEGLEGGQALPAAHARSPTSSHRLSASSAPSPLGGGAFARPGLDPGAHGRGQEVEVVERAPRGSGWR